jgi:uncharacterized membrane protein
MVTVEQPVQVVDLESNQSTFAAALAANDIGTATLKLDRFVAAERYADGGDTGSFILVDPERCDTTALGIIETVKAPASRAVGPKILDFVRSAETRARSAAKALTWRVTGSLDTFMLAALISKNLHIALGVALAEVLTKTLLYYIHERAWTLVRWGRRSDLPSSQNVGL